MATIVRHNATGKNYCLLGTGFGAYQSKKPNMFLGNWMADVDVNLRNRTCFWEIGWQM